MLEFEFQVLTVGALHQADSAALRSAASAWHDELAPVPKPLLVVNVGGPTSNFLCTYDLSNFCSFQTPIQLKSEQSNFHAWSTVVFRGLVWFF